MKFIEKTYDEVDVACGDFILFADNSLGLITDKGRGYVGVVFLDNGYESNDFDCDEICDLVHYLNLNFTNFRFIKSKNIEVIEK